MDVAGTPGLRAPYALEYTYRRSLGPVIGRFLSGLSEGRIEGVRTASGKVLVPPVEYDPDSGEAVVDFVPVGETGTVTTWAWVSEPRPRQPLDRPFAWALIRLDGADTAMLHAVDAGREERMSSGMRVKVRWSESRVGSIKDIACFEPVAQPVERPRAPDDHPVGRPRAPDDHPVERPRAPDDGRGGTP